MSSSANACFRAHRPVLSFVWTPHRHASTSSAPKVMHFYQNKQLELYASKSAHRLTLRQLVFFGRSMNAERIIKSANYVRTELPVRIAHRLRDLQALPFVVVTQEEVAKVYELYWSAFEKLRRFPPIATLDENDRFCEFVSSLLDEHATVIPALSLGLSLSSPHLPPEKLDAFMRRMLVSRISRRVLAQHHIALSASLRNGENSRSSGHVGIIHTHLDVRESIEKCVELLTAAPPRVFSPEADGEELAGKLNCPRVIVDGHAGTKFAYIQEHFEYIMFELLKNAMQHRTASTTPLVRATIAAGKDDIQVRISDEGGGLTHSTVKAPSDLFSFSHVRNTTRMENERIGALRTVSASPRGMRATVDEQVTEWKSTDPGKTADMIAHQRIGIGLPMSYIFATYFGGSLELVSLDGWGTDVYLRLPKLGTRLEEIEV
ncbi:atypical/PDHK/BCKDK protein kinase [Rickenella mellea]|uniref:Protein-serine/threonine kinase n=1 Tax=Rickenella mellea TaxID=50990 RepID=A0A4R5XFD7_9AGAM|nr:atypical/PDHK/BCKDK protein kinase [Rickenella mellea]